MSVADDNMAAAQVVNEIKEKPNEKKSTIGKAAPQVNPIDMHDAKGQENKEHGNEKWRETV